MSEPQLPRAVDPAPRCALLARAVARPQPGLATAIVCSLALAAGGIHSLLQAGGVPPAGTAAAIRAAPAAVVTSVAPRRCRHRRVTRRRASRALGRCTPLPA